MFNSMRLEEPDEPSQAAKLRNIRTAMSELDPVVTYGSFGQVRFAYTCKICLLLYELCKLSCCALAIPVLHLVALSLCCAAFAAGA